MRNTGKDMSDFAWALIGPGRIAHRFADAVHRLPGAYLRSAFGRGAPRAAEFARHWTRVGKPPPRVEPTLAAVLGDAAIDAVYVATPHAVHGELIRRCIEAGKPVRCEKPLVPTLAVARELVTLAQDRGVFLMEALWSRFLPIYAQVGDWLRSGAIGQVNAIQSSFCFPVPYDPGSRLFNAALAGGCLLDIGVYNVAMTRWVLEAALGACPAPVSLHAEGVLAPSGVEQRAAATIVFPGGVVSQFVCGFDSQADNTLRIFGDAGCVSVPQRFWEATEAVLSRPSESPQVVCAPFRINGFEEEIEETMRCVRAGGIESPRMPHAETLAIVGCLDALRHQIGVRYPFE
jgi:predicted dehydrogenase